MYRGQRACRALLGLSLSLSLVFSPIANAAGYYNFGMQWKGGLNPYRLGADSSYQSGFTSGLGSPVSGSQDGAMSGPFAPVRDASGNLYVSDNANNRIEKYDSSGVFQGWIGKIATSPTGGAAGCNGAAVGTFTPGWCTGGSSTSGTGDGMLNHPNSLALDASGNLYVADSNNYRINKYNSSGVFQGWIGKIATSPTGGAAGCNGAGVGTFTPGWCTGGTSTSGTGNGMMSASYGLALDSTGNLYVADTFNSRIEKYDSSGIFQGWIGKILTSPTGGAAGCNGAGGGTFTPGWCTGGTSVSGTGDGMLNGPFSVALDSSDNLYVADSFNYRINKYNSSGAFQGWIGNIATSPTGGAAGCNGAGGGTFTPGWCTGGVSTSGTGDGMLSSSYGLALDSSGNLYVADTFNQRISKYNSSAAFQGWIGKIATSPTGGAAGCNGAGVGTLTPGWCTGGTSTSGTGDGMLNTPYGLTVDSSGNLYVADGGNNRIGKYNSAGALIGAIQSIAVFYSWHRSPADSVAGTGNGMLNSPSGVAVDSSGNLYVIDKSNSRINKYNSSGAFQGWIGKIATSPTGGAAGCNGAGVGTFTPGWCTGGTSTSGTGDGMLNSPSGIAVDSSGNLYVVDTSNSRINKYNSLGAFQGWIGSIATSPTGGAAGCNGAGAGTFTLGWCTGGTSAAGTGDGMLSNPNGIVVNSSGNLYVADTTNNRIEKYNSLGAFQGWIGNIATSPTGGAAGCNGAGAGTFTLGWCTGGTSTSGTGDGMLNTPKGLTVDSSGSLYVVDTSNSRINKYNSSGAFQGWIGSIATSPTGGAAGCNGAGAGTFTLGWCTGGTSTSGTGDGMLNSPVGIAVDSSSGLYVADTTNNRIEKYNSLGAFQGWIGKVATSPTGGAAGCNGAGVGTFTPGWCKGGSSTSGKGDGMLNTPKGLAVDSSDNLYVADSSNKRIIRYSTQGR